MTTRCICCDLPIESCGRAIEARVRDAAAAYRQSMLDHGWITAQFPGVCGNCGVGFGPGALIRRAICDTGWVSDCCPISVGVT